MEPQEQQESFIDNAEFEASLISDMDTVSVTAETEILDTSKVRFPTEKPQPAWIGKRLGNFKLLRLIGEGKMGRVIQAQDINLHRIVALKILNKRIPGVDEQQRVLQFLREARAAAKLEHPNVVRIYEINQHDGWWYIAMEMLEGENLKKIVKAAGPLSQNRACTLIADAANALAAAHELGIIHRDIKPTNLMLTRSGRCKLTDFGLVRLDDPDDPFDFTDKAVGSPQFMAPEVISRQKQTSAIDIYSLGATLYYALTAKPPYLGKNIDEILKKHINDPVPDLTEQLPQCSPSLAELLKRMMAKDPEHRPSAADVTATLRVEAIGSKAGDSSLLGTGDSTLLLRPQDSRIGAQTITATPAPAPALKQLINQLSANRSLFLAITLLVILVLLALSLTAVKFWLPKKTRLIDYAGFFPNSPQTYGVLPRQTVLTPITPKTTDPPPFSWKGKFDTAGFEYVAGKSGHYFYPINSPQAILIRAEDFIGYKSADDAIADGKILAP
jgi:serine/threonine protein kinase